MRMMDSIKRLRRKIVGVTITSLSGVLIIMTASVNAYSFARTTKEADNALNIIANNRGIYPEKDFFDSEESTKPVELSHGIGYCTYYFKNNSPEEVVYQIPFLSRIKIRVFKARFFDLAYKAGYWQGQSCPFLNRPIALVTLTYP